MNILVVGPIYPDSFAFHITETLQKDGHTVFNFEPRIKYSLSNNRFQIVYHKIKTTLYKDLSNLKVIRKIKQIGIDKILSTKKVDLTISCHDFLESALVDKIKNETGSIVVMWNPDHFSSVGKLMFLNGKYDFCFFEDPYMPYIFRREFKLNAYYLPSCFNPDYHRKPDFIDQDQKKYDCDIATVGHIHPSREALIKYLNKYNVMLWGGAPPNWMNSDQIKKMLTYKQLQFVEKSKAFYYPKIALNTIHPANVLGLNCRAFEIAGAGGFQLAGYRLGGHQLFTADKEIVMFQTPDELIEKVDYYLAHEDERKLIAEAGYIRAQNCHTYKKRLELMFDTIFNGSKGYEMPEIKLT